MDTFARALVSLVAGVVAAVAVGVGVTALLAPYVWPSALVGLPVGLVAGVATVALAWLGVAYRAERAETGHASATTVRRLWTTLAAVVGFVLGGALAVAVLATQAVGLATALLTGGLPVGLVSAAVAAVLVSRRIRTRERPGRPA